MTSCTLPFNSRLQVLPFSHYTVQPGDFNLPGHNLRDDAALGWNDLCNDPAGTGNTNCNANPPDVGAASLSLIQKLNSSTATDIHNAAHAVVTAVAVGTTVHDFVTVTGQPGNPIPTGNVTVDWFLNGDCSGAPAQNSGPVGPLSAAGQFDATAFAFPVNAAGFFAFRAHYLGDPTYNPSDGLCEPLRVVDANIQISPNGVNRVGATHTFTAHVNVNDGTGFVPAVGALVNFTIDSGPGTLSNGNVSATSCSTNASGNCTIDLTSAVTGVTTVSAHTTLSVGGVSLTRNTDGTDSNSAPATKRWVNAKIAITPTTATNRVGAPHTFTVTLMKDLGDGAGFVAAPGEHVDVTLTDGNGATHTAPTGTCTNAGPNTDAAGQCTITFTSNSTGTVTGHASSLLSVAGSAPFTVETDGVAPNSGNAVKTFVNARISIAPNATNEVGQPHTFTVTLEKDTGTGTFVPAAGETVTVTLTARTALRRRPSGPFTGHDERGRSVHGHVHLADGGQGDRARLEHALGRRLGAVHGRRRTASAGELGRRGEDVRGREHPDHAATATNRVGATHTFTAHVNINAGDGNGFVNAPDGTVISFTIDSGPGSFTSPNPCTTAGGTGSCTVTSRRPYGRRRRSPRTTTVIGRRSRAHADDERRWRGNSGPATKTWVNARIAIAPNATNEVGQPHTFTVTLQKDIGDGAGFVAGCRASTST